MKARFIFAAMAALAIVSCNKNSVEPQVPSLDGPSAMLKVNIKAADGMTKAFSAGTAEENAVSKVDFYFYDSAGKAYSVVTGSNAITWTAETPGTSTNIEKVSDAVLVIKQAEDTPPTQVVAVLNGTESYEGLTLAELGNKVVKALHKENTDFVMTNSVYYDEGSTNAVVAASQITQENIFVLTDDTTPGVGENIVLPEGVKPIDIYVERVAAKVTFVEYNPAAKVPVKNAKGEQMVDSEGNAVFAQFTGWNVTNATDEAYTVKNLSESYEFTWTWNDAADYRSFWANTTDTPEHKHTFNALEQHTAGFDYYFENTHATEHSQFLVAARLVNEAGENVSLAQWFNVYYTVADLKVAIVNTLKAKVFVQAGENTFNSITVDDVVFYQKPTVENGTTNEKRYEVLVKAKEGVTYYKADGKTAYTAEEIAAVFGEIAPAKMWEEGMTYYFTTIKHISADYPALVRNHDYQIKVTGVKGFGTPVYDPEQVIIPEIPEDQDALNLAAEINVLSWNVITQEVELGF